MVGGRINDTQGVNSAFTGSLSDVEAIDLSDKGRTCTPVPNFPYAVNDHAMIVQNKVSICLRLQVQKFRDLNSLPPYSRPSVLYTIHIFLIF